MWEIVIEEVDELEEAISRRDIVELADGVVDVLYTCPQLAIMCGIDIPPIWHAVHQANLMKADGPVDRRTGKRLKPPGWKHPDISQLLLAQHFPLFESPDFAEMDRRDRADAESE